MPVASTISQLLEATRAHVGFALEHGGEQVLANVSHVAELARRYFTGHGPATERDLAYWASLTLTDVRAALAAVADRLESFEHDGRTYWYGQPPPSGDPLEPRGHLLLVLDEFHNGYQDSRDALDADGIRPPGDRGANVGMALVDGQMVGDVRRTLRRATATFDVGLFRELGRDEADALHAAGARYGRFLNLDAEVVLTRRSP